MDNKTKILIGVAVTIVVAGAGVTAFFLLRQKKVNNPLALGNGGQRNIGNQSVPSASTPEETPSNNWSQVEMGFDGDYNYQKRDGIWWTAKKSNPDNWVSLADPKWAVAVDRLNAAYPND